MRVGQIEIPADRLAWLESIQLSGGGHENIGSGVCAMEAAAYIAGEEHSDHPSCVCPIIAAFLRRWNDDLDDADRNRLIKPLVLRVLGTRSLPDVESTRAWMATDWLVRECAPAWLRLAAQTRPDLAAHADALAALSQVDSSQAASAAQPIIAAAGAAWDAAEAVARAAARDVAGDAARDAAGAAARAAARAVARDAAWAAAWAVARAAARDAALATARDALSPTINDLQQSALRLLDRMIAAGSEEVTA